MFKIGLARSTIPVLFIAAMTLFPMSGFTAGDGMGFGKNGERFSVDEKEQYAIIAHQAGIEKMLLSIQFDWVSSTEIAWVVPIPARGDQIQLEIANGAPKFQGIDIRTGAREDLVNLQTQSIAQISLNYYFIYSQTLSQGGGGVDMYQHRELGNVVAEVISSSGGKDIYEYLTAKGLNTSIGLVPLLDKYVQMNYSFVTAWFVKAEYQLYRPGVIVEFPSKEPCYPLMLTGTYGKLVVPTEIILPCLVTPRAYPGIQDYSHVGYYRGGPEWENGWTSRSVRNFTRDSLHSNQYFTRVEINAPSEEFTADLWFSTSAPESTKYPIWVHATYGGSDAKVLMFNLHLLSCVLTSIIMGMFFFKRGKGKLLGSLFLGLLGWIGPILLCMAFFFLRIEYKYPLRKIIIFMILFYLITMLPFWLVPTVALMSL